MNLYHNALSFTASFVLLIGLLLTLRGKGIISKTDAPAIARLTIDFVLPCLLLGKLPFIHLTAEIFWTSSYLILSEIMIGVASYYFGKSILNLKRPSLAVFILCSTFGSTAILGSAFMTAIFSGDAQSVAAGLLISQLSVGIPAYVAMPAISIYFSEDKNIGLNLRTIIDQIVLSPSIIAIVIGLLWSISASPTSGLLITPFFNTLNYAGVTLVFMVALLNALALQPINIKNDSGTILSCAILILLVEPVCVYWLDQSFDVSIRYTQTSFILAAMPSANSVIAYAIRYRTDEKLAATLVTSTALLSAITIPSIMPFFSVFT
jgi:predicted permease